MIELAVAAAISLVVLGATMSLLISMMTQRTATERSRGRRASRRARAIDRLSRQLRNLASPADVITNSALIKPKSVDRNLPFDLVFKDVDEGALTSASNPRERAPRALLPADERLDPRRRRRHHRARRAVGADPAHLGRDADPARGPAAGGDCPGPGWDDQRRVADYLVNASDSPPDPLFRYSSASGEITATDDAAREQIIRVEADLHVDPDPAKRPLAAHLTARSSLRNQNRAPSAFFSYVVTNSSPARCSSTAPPPRTPRTSG